MAQLVVGRDASRDVSCTALERLIVSPGRTLAVAAALWRAITPLIRTVNGMSSAPLLSALIVNYNTSALTRDCVSSLRAQRLTQPDGTQAEIEIIVVDNASRLEERALLKGIKATVYYSEENRGY